MTEIQNNILQYLKNSKESDIYEIREGIGLHGYNPIEKVRGAIQVLIKQGHVCKGSPSKYKAVNINRDNQTTLF